MLLSRHTRRREFITLLGGAAAWPLAARAQQPERMRRIGVLLPAVANDPEYQARVGAFMQALALLGWADGRNVRIETRCGASDAGRVAAKGTVIRPGPGNPLHRMAATKQVQHVADL
jgi:putative ABC transport system substrate-binding protein